LAELLIYSKVEKLYLKI